MKTKTQITILFCVLAGTVVLAYLPTHWNNRCANSDLRDSPAVIIGRVTGISRLHEVLKSDDKTTHAFTYIAGVTVGKVFRGNMKTNDVLKIRLGSYLQRQIDETEPRELLQCNTQAGFNLRINGVYLLALCKDPSSKGEEDFWAPSSGHRSIHPIERLYDQVIETNAAGVVRHGFPSHSAILLRNYGSWSRADYMKQFRANSTNLEDFIKTYINTPNNLYPDDERDNVATNVIPIEL